MLIYPNDLPKGNYYTDIDINSDINHVIIKKLDQINTSTGNHWKKYRIADSIEKRDFKNPPEKIKDKWPNSFLDNYHNKEPCYLHGIDKIYNMIHEQKVDYKMDNIITMHLRIGDIMRPSHEKVYTYSFDYYKNLDIEKYTKNKIIVVVCGAHDNVCSNASRKYVSTVYNILSEKGFNVLVRSGNSPDDDFFFLCRSHYFISGRGGYSKYVKLLVKKNNKIIIEHIDD